MNPVFRDICSAPGGSIETIVKLHTDGYPGGSSHVMTARFKIIIIMIKDICLICAGLLYLLKQLANVTPPDQRRLLFKENLSVLLIKLVQV